MSATDDFAVDVRNVSKTYGEGVLAFEALKGVSMQVKRGEFLILEGPSGSGKTTLLSIMGGVLSPTRGQMIIFGQDIAALRESALTQLRRHTIGFIFQGFNLITSLSALDNVALVLRLRGYSQQDADTEATHMLALVGLADKLKSTPLQLSGGQKQRVAVARALAGSPPLILADEPTASLDAHTGLTVTELLKDLSRKQGATVLVVTHDNRIFHLADRIVRIEDGMIHT